MCHLFDFFTFDHLHLIFLLKNATTSLIFIHVVLLGRNQHSSASNNTSSTASSYRQSALNVNNASDWGTPPPVKKKNKSTKTNIVNGNIDHSQKPNNVSNDTQANNLKTSKSSNTIHKSSDKIHSKESGREISSDRVYEDDQVLDNVGLNHTRHKLVPDGNDFKLVFISSDSSKESDNLNSSLEGANSPEGINQSTERSNDNGTTNGFHLDKKGNKVTKSNNKDPSKSSFDCIATSSPKGGRSAASKTPPKLPPKSNSRKQNFDGSNNSSGASSLEMDPSKRKGNSSGKSSATPQFMLDHDFHHYDTGIIGGGSCSSPSINTIRTAATRDVDSPVSCP